VLGKMGANRLYKNRDQFKRILDPVLEGAGLSPSSAVYKAILAALAERDDTADICTDSKGNPEADSDLRDTESIPLPKVPLPLPIQYKVADGKEPDNEALVKLVLKHCEEYFAREVLPHWPDAWIDYSKTRVGYEIPINRHFYEYEPPRALEDIERDIKDLERDIIAMLGVAA